MSGSTCSQGIGSRLDEGRSETVAVLGRRRKAGPSLRVLTLLQIPLHRFAFVRWLNARLILWTVRSLMWRLGIRRPVLWFVVPHVSSLVGRLSESLSIYYCIDDYASLPDVDVEAVRAMDEALMRKADLVFVASDTLLVGKSAPEPEHAPQPSRRGHQALWACMRRR